jgi:hypothetical protein
VVAEPGALELAVAERPEPRRWSKLRELLATAPPQRQAEASL